MNWNVNEWTVAAALILSAVFYWVDRRRIKKLEKALEFYADEWKFDEDEQFSVPTIRLLSDEGAKAIEAVGTAGLTGREP